jgi:hypothetical protein
MKLTTAVLVLMAGFFVAGAQERFSGLWYDGNAEISTYRLTETRYGEERTGVRVMVFVTEPMRLSTHIKPDSKLADNEQIPVIKLNDLRKFNTGIYDYSVMTSVFASVEKRTGIPSGSTMKVAFSAQEWCGVVYERLRRLDSAYSGSLYSYFESEGETDYRIPHDGNVETEDNLWLLVRELRGPIMKTGQRKSLRVIPSTWLRRKEHAPATVVTAVLQKGAPTPRQTALGTITAVPFNWEIEGKKTEVWVEEQYPHRILSWIERDGSRGEILATKRSPYWKQNDNASLSLRSELGLGTAAPATENRVTTNP